MSTHIEMMVDDSGRLTWMKVNEHLVPIPTIAVKKQPEHEHVWWSYWIDKDLSGDHFVTNFKGTELEANDKLEKMRKNNPYMILKPGRGH